jgi:hypothetical protein
LWYTRDEGDDPDDWMWDFDFAPNPGGDGDAA